MSHEPNIEQLFPNMDFTQHNDLWLPHSMVPQKRSLTQRVLSPALAGLIALGAMGYSTAAHADSGDKKDEVAKVDPGKHLGGVDNHDDHYVIKIDRGKSRDLWRAINVVLKKEHRHGKYDMLKVRTGLVNATVDHTISYLDQAMDGMSESELKKTKAFIKRISKDSVSVKHTPGHSDKYSCVPASRKTVRTKDGALGDNVKAGDILYMPRVVFGSNKHVDLSRLEKLDCLDGLCDWKVTVDSKLMEHVKALEKYEKWIKKNEKDIGDNAGAIGKNITSISDLDRRLTKLEKDFSGLRHDHDTLKKAGFSTKEIKVIQKYHGKSTKAPKKERVPFVYTGGLWIPETQLELRFGHADVYLDNGTPFLRQNSLGLTLSHRFGLGERTFLSFESNFDREKGEYRSAYGHIEDTRLALGVGLDRKVANHILVGVEGEYRFRSIDFQYDDFENLAQGQEVAVGARLTLDHPRFLGSAGARYVHGTVTDDPNASNATAYELEGEIGVRRFWKSIPIGASINAFVRDESSELEDTDRSVTTIAGGIKLRMDWRNFQLFTGPVLKQSYSKANDADALEWQLGTKVLW